MTLFGGFSYDGLNAAIGFQHTGPKSEGELVTLIVGYSYDGFNAAIGVQHTGPDSGGELMTLFWQLLL